MAYLQSMWQLAMAGSTQGLYFWIAAYTFLVCGYSTIYQIRTRYWPCVRGQLLKADLSYYDAKDWVRSNQNYVADALYSYSVNGADYQGKRVSPWLMVASHNARFVLQRQLAKIDVQPDGCVQVFYKPTNPKKSFLIVANTPGIVITLMISILPLAGYIWHYHS